MLKVPEIELFHKQNRWKDAWEHERWLLLTNTENISEVLYLHMVSSAKLNLWKYALAIGKKLMQKPHRKLEYFSTYANVLSLNNEFYKAIEIIHNGLELYQNDPELIGAKALILTRNGDYNKAIACARKITEEDDDCLLAQIAVGWSLLESGMIEQAIPYLQKAINHPKKELFASYLLIKAFRKKNEFKKAFTESEKAIDYFGNNPVLLEQKLLLLYHTNQYEQVDNLCNEILATNKSIGSCLGLKALIAYKNGKISQVSDLLKRLESHVPIKQEILDELQKEGLVNNFSVFEHHLKQYLA